MGSIPGSGRYPGGGHHHRLCYSYLESHSQRRLEGYSLWGHRESDMTEATRTCITESLCSISEANPIL